MNTKCLTLSSLAMCALLACSGGGGNNVTGTGAGSGSGSGTGSSGCDDGSVCVLASAFSPVALTIARSASVTWVAKTGVLHNIVFDSPVSPGVTDIGNFSDGSVSRSFSAIGTFPYHCTIHANMKGTIKVQ
ncbi:MAG: plastocyanin/azurin family copper-binding protein [Gemmatimonadaceae bacterium]